jgi:hypothetical protein
LFIGLLSEKVRKVKNLTKEKPIGITIDLLGKFEELINSNELKIAIQKLKDIVQPLITTQNVHQMPHLPFPPTDFNRAHGSVYRIRLNEKTGRSIFLGRTRIT